MEEVAPLPMGMRCGKEREGAMTGIAEVWRVNGKAIVGPTHVGSDLVTVEVLSGASRALNETLAAYGDEASEAAKELIEKRQRQFNAALAEPFVSIPMHELLTIYWREPPKEIRRALAPVVDETDPFDGEPDAEFAAYEGDEE